MGVEAKPQYLLHGAGNTYQAVNQSRLENMENHKLFNHIGGEQTWKGKRKSSKKKRRRKSRKVRKYHTSRRTGRRARKTRRRRRTRLSGGAACGSGKKITVPSSHARVAGGGPQSFNALSANTNATRATALCNSVYDGPYTGWKTIPSN